MGRPKVRFVICMYREITLDREITVAKREIICFRSKMEPLETQVNILDQVVSASSREIENLRSVLQLIEKVYSRNILLEKIIENQKLEIDSLTALLKINQPGENTKRAEEEKKDGKKTWITTKELRRNRSSKRIKFEKLPAIKEEIL